jgi:hypothetical protein
MKPKLFTPNTRPDDRQCVNHPERLAHAPSHVLCRECFEELDAKMQNLKDLFKKRDEK